MLYLYLTAFAVFLCTILVVVVLDRVVNTVRTRRRLSEVLGARAPPLEEKARTHIGAGSLTRVDAVINSLSKLSLPAQRSEEHSLNSSHITRSRMPASA